MFNKKAWGGNNDPVITVKFTPHHDDHIVSMIIFEFRDEGFLGRFPSEDSFDVRTLPPPLLISAWLIIACNVEL